jgi:hypothetical protein
MKRTGRLGFLLLTLISLTAGAVLPSAGLAGDTVAEAADNVVFGLPDSMGGGDAITGVDGDPDDVIGGNKDHSGTTDEDGHGEEIVRDLRLFEEMMRYLSSIFSLRI